MERGQSSSELAHIGLRAYALVAKENGTFGSMLLTAICALLLGISASQVQQPPAQADAQDVRNLLRLTGFSQVFDAMLNAVAPAQAENMKAAMAVQLKNAGKEVDARALERAAVLFVGGFRKLFTAEALESEAVSIYQRHFTAEEIRGLVEFWGSPLGRKLAEKNPVLVQEGAGAGRKLAEQTVAKLLQDPEFMEKVRAVFGEGDRK
jgi:hypothetical protein